MKKYQALILSSFVLILLSLSIILFPKSHHTAISLTEKVKDYPKLELIEQQNSRIEVEYVTKTLAD